MRITSLIILAMVHLVLGTDDDKKHVHFKIYVPEIVKHHFHTKTVYIHVHHPPPKDPPKKEPPKKKLNHYEEGTFENWNLYNTYDNEGNHEEIGENGEVHKKGHEKHRGTKGNNFHRDFYDSYLPTSYGNMDPVNTYNGISQPNNNHNFNNADGNSQYDAGQDMVGYMSPPQYAIHENVNDVPNNDIEQYNVYEEGYKRGHESETGHLITKNLKDFYDDKLDESGDFKNEGYEKEYNNDKRIDSEHRGNYDKEIGQSYRSSRNNAQKRFFSPKIILR